MSKEAKGEETGPIMSKTFPTTFKFSSMTAEPSFGVFSVLTTIFWDGVTFRIRPKRCKHIPLAKNDYVNVIVYLNLSTFNGPWS